jgi:hypothetical protein
MVIVAMLVIGVLGAGIYSLTNSSTFTGLLSNKNDQAYQLAQAGVRYAIDKYINQGITNLAVTNFSLPDQNHQFNISIANSVITSIGIVNAGTFLEAQRQIIYNLTADWGSTCTGTCIGGICTGGNGSCPPIPPGPVITGQTGAFSPTESAAGAITVSSTGTITLGGNVGGNSGVILYQGSSSVSNCNAGACYFPCGLRAYFQFTANEDNSSGSTNIGDGFTFAVLNALNNTRNCSGGAPAGVNMGELMGYAGPGTSDGKGLQPPKMAIEFDFYSNAGTETYNGCSSGRNDSANNHMALMFWGLNLAGNCATGSTASGYPQASFDDNIHGAGDGTINNPYNSASTGNGSGLGGYYEGAKTTCKTLTNPTNTCNWMEDGHIYSFRLEISKATAGDGSGNGLYQINAWIYRDSDTIPTGFNDVTNPFTASLPQISRTVTLSAANHTALNQIYFGFTEATGAASQNVQISNLGVFFPQLSGGVCTGACTYAITPTSLAVAYGGATGQTVAVTAATGCTWTAVSDSTTWLTVTGGASGTSFGTVTYNVAADTGPARTGHIIIGGQTFTVTQAVGLPTCTLAAGSNIVPNGGTNTLTWTIANGPANGTFAGTLLGGCTNFTNSNGGSCTTAAQTTAGAITDTLTVTNASGSNNCSTTFYVGCQNYSVYNNTGSRLYFKATGSTCTRVSSGNQITATLASGGTVTRYSATDTTCATALGSINYTAAMNADIVANGGNGNCLVNYGNNAVNDTVTDR